MDVGNLMIDVSERLLGEGNPLGSAQLEPSHIFHRPKLGGMCFRRAVGLDAMTETEPTKF